MTESITPEEKEFLDALVEEQQKAARELSKANHVLHEALLEIHFRQFGVKSGVVVEYRGKKYIIAGVRACEHSARSGLKPSASGYMIRKDGTPMERARYLFSDWKIEK
jgi:hypothetical protein